MKSWVWSLTTCFVAATTLTNGQDLDQVKEVTSLEQLQTLLSYEGSEIPETVSQLTNLEVIIIRGENLTSVHPALFTLPNLVEIDLSNNLLERVEIRPPTEVNEPDYSWYEPETVTTDPKVERLNLANNKLKFIGKETASDEGAFQLKNLLFLQVENNELERLPLLFDGVQTTAQFSLQGNPWACDLGLADWFTDNVAEKLIASTFCADGTRTLTQAKNELKEVRSLAGLQRLLNYEGNFVPDNVTLLHSLRVISIPNSDLTSVSPELFTLPDLVEVDFSSNLLETVLLRSPGDPKIEVLNLSNNSLTLLGEATAERVLADEPVLTSSFKLKALVSFQVENNKLKSLPNWFDESNSAAFSLAGNDWDCSLLFLASWFKSNVASNLVDANETLCAGETRTLQQARNEKIGIREVRSLAELQSVLEFEGNFVPDTVRVLEELEVIVVTHSNLTSVSSELFSLPNLREVDLSHNLLETVLITPRVNPSTNFIENPNFERINLANNNLTFLGEFMGDYSSSMKFENIIVFRVENNHLTRIPSWIPDSLSPSVSIGLEGNPWNCNCKLREWFKEGHVNNLRAPEITLCDDDTEYSGQPIYERGQVDLEPCYAAQGFGAENKTSTSVALEWEYSPVASDFVPFIIDLYDRAADGPVCETCSRTKWIEEEPRPRTSVNFVANFGFQIRYGKTGSSDKQYICCWLQRNIDTSKFRARVANLLPYQEYDFEVRASNVLFWTPRSDGLFDPVYFFGAFVKPFTVKTEESIPSVPRNIRLVPDSKTDSTLTLTWSTPEPANGEILQYAIRELVTGEEKETNETNVIFFSLRPDTEYQFQVRAKTSVGWGNWSDPPFSESTKSLCPLGTQKDVQNNCAACTRGEYGEYDARGFPVCEKCPDDLPLTLMTGSIGVESCVAPKEMFRFGNTSEECLKYPGMDCSKEGLDLVTVGIKRGYWRPTGQSLDIRSCTEGYCRGFLTGSQLKSSDDQCETGHTGALCSGCVEKYAMGFEGCKMCSEEIEDADRRRFIGWLVFALIISLIPATYVMLLALVASWEHRGVNSKSCLFRLFSSPEKEKEKSSKNADKLTVGVLFGLASAAFSGTKIRITIGFFQVLYQYVTTIVETLRKERIEERKNGEIVDLLANLDLSSVLSLFDIRCFFDYDYYTYVAFYALFPVAIGFFMLLCLGLVRAAFSDGFSKAKQTSLWALLYTLFLVYPGLSSAILSSLLPEYIELDTSEEPVKESVLAADYSVDFDSDRSKTWRKSVVVLILAYPVGVFVLFTVVVHLYHKKYKKTKQKLQDAENEEPEEDDAGSLSEEEKSKTPRASAPKSLVLVRKGHSEDVKKDMSTKALAAAEFLMRNLREDSYWYECLELVRKLLMTSVFIIFFELVRDAAQPFFVFIALVFIAILMKRRPYLNVSEQVLAEVSLGLLLLLSIFTPTFGNENDLYIFTIAAICVQIASLIVSVIYNMVQLRKEQTDKFKDQKDITLNDERDGNDRQENKASFQPSNTGLVIEEDLSHKQTAPENPAPEKAQIDVV